eukprot:13414960-Alexandrium_andersonii.AAC.1
MGVGGVVKGVGVQHRVQLRLQVLRARVGPVARGGVDVDDLCRARNVLRQRMANTLHASRGWNSVHCSGLEQRFSTRSLNGISSRSLVTKGRCDGLAWVGLAESDAPIESLIL